MRQFLRDTELTLTLFALFLLSLGGQALTGWRAQAEELRLHALLLGSPPGGDPSHAPARCAYEKSGFGPELPSVYLYKLL